MFAPPTSHPRIDPFISRWSSVVGHWSLVIGRWSIAQDSTSGIEADAPPWRGWRRKGSGTCGERQRRDVPVDGDPRTKIGGGQPRIDLDDHGVRFREHEIDPDIATESGQ